MSAMHEFTSFLAPQMIAFVSYRKASGRWCFSYEQNIKLFEKHCETNFPDSIELSQGMVDTWCAKRKTESNNSCCRRIYPVANFIRYLRKRGLIKINEPAFPRRTGEFYIPHSFTQQELNNFFVACDTIPPTPNRKEHLALRMIVPVFFRLLYSSGLRTNEARLLRREDVNLADGVMSIRFSKGYAQHHVVLHDSMLSILQEYDIAIDKQYPQRTYFFPGRNDNHLSSSWLCGTFRRLWDKSNGGSPVPYDLRHNYATENINNWTDEGFGFDDKLLYLSKSMGHANLHSTKSYYSLVPQLSGIIEANTSEDGIIPEVVYESL